MTCTECRVDPCYCDNCVNCGEEPCVCVEFGVLDIYGNAYVPPDGSGYEDEDFDGEALVDNLLSREMDV